MNRRIGGLPLTHWAVLVVLAGAVAAGVGAAVQRVLAPDPLPHFLTSGAFVGSAVTGVTVGLALTGIHLLVSRGLASERRRLLMIARQASPDGVAAVISTSREFLKASEAVGLGDRAWVGVPTIAATSSDGDTITFWQAGRPPRAVFTIDMASVVSISGADAAPESALVLDVESGGRRIAVPLQFDLGGPDDAAVQFAELLVGYQRRRTSPSERG